MVSALGLVAQIDAATLVVAPKGNDSAAGTAEQPFRTISRAAELAQPGDTVLVRAGVYRERVAPARGGEEGKPIVYRAAPGERVIVKGSERWSPAWRAIDDGVYAARPDAALFDDRSEEYLDNHNPFKVELSSTPWHREGRREHERKVAGESRIHGTDDRIVYTCGQVFVNGERLKEVPLEEELRPLTWHYDPDTENVLVHFGDLVPAEQEVEITTRRRLFAPQERGLGYIVLEGFVFEHCGNQYPTNFWDTDTNAQKGAVGTEAGHHWVIRRNVIRHAKTFAIDAGCVDRHTPKNAPHDTLIEENYLVDNGSAGILSNASLRLIVRGNVVLRNNCLRFEGIKRWEQAGVKCHQFNQGLIEGNYLADNYDTYGVWLDNQFPDSRVTRNVIHGNGVSGIFLEMSDYEFDRLLVDNNVIFDNAQNAVYIHDASGATFVNNLLANTGDTRGRGQGVYIQQAMARTKTYHHSFFNNLLIGNPRNVDVNYPAFRSGPQRFDANVYGIERKAKEFLVNNKSDRPRPWSEDEFRELMKADLAGGKGVEPAALSGELAKLTLDQWRAFWKTHGVENDARSQTDPSARVDYDRGSQTIEVSLSIDPTQVEAIEREDVATDFYGEDLQTRVPGPFQELKKGLNRFKVWDGLPILAEGELPPADWNR